MQKVILWSMALVAFALLLGACNSTSEQNPIEATTTGITITPPIPRLAQDYQEFEVDNSQENILEIASGTKIIFPAGSLIDADGNPIEGTAKIKYREFHDAIDVFLSGIPMKYKENGQEETFQTAGMYEMRGEQEGKEIFIDKNKPVEVKLASFEAGEDYDFYFLNEKGQGWEFVDSSYDMEVNVSKKERMEKLKAKEAQTMKFPLGKNYFAFNYSAILDVNYNDNYSKIRKNYENPVVANKAKSYGLSWTNLYCYDNITYSGTQQPAAMMVWKKIQGKRFPKWLQDDKRDATSITKKYGNVYSMRVESRDGKSVYEATIQAVMPLASLYKFPPSYWNNNYQTAMQEVDKELKRVAKEAEVYRSYKVAGFGIYNYDRFLKEEERIDILANFEADEAIMQENKAYELNQVYCFLPDGKTMIDMPKREWDRAALLPGQAVHFITVLPGEKIAVFTAEEYLKLDFAGYAKTGERPQVDFIFHEKEVEEEEDLRMLVGR